MFCKYLHYLKKTRFFIIIKSDYKNLRTFMIKKKLIKRQVSWYEELLDVNFLIEHI